jgi:hypothetical protein
MADIQYNNKITAVQATPIEGEEAPGQDDNENTFRWLVGWAVVIVLASLANRTRFGHAFLYYSLALMLIFLVVTQYRFIIAALGPVGQPIPGNTLGDN